MTVRAQPDRPVIGIAVRYGLVVGPATSGPGIRDAAPDRDFLRLRPRYVTAVTASGGIPVLLPPLEELPLNDALALVDGVILPGGDDELTQEELNAVRDLVALGIPVLGICRGAQVLNVALGGKLAYQLPTDVIDHRTNVDLTVLRHPIQVDETSKLYRLTGPTPIVNSAHFWAVSEPGTDLTAVAHAPDGTIEAIEGAGHPWLLGVQFHPEALYASQSWCRALFDELVRASALSRNLVLR